MEVGPGRTADGRACGDRLQVFVTAVGKRDRLAPARQYVIRNHEAAGERIEQALTPRGGKLRKDRSEPDRADQLPDHGTFDEDARLGITGSEFQGGAVEPVERPSEIPN